MGIVDFFASWKGRANRVQFFVGLNVVGAVQIAAILLLSTTTVPLQDQFSDSVVFSEAPASVAQRVALPATYFASFCLLGPLATRRAHDTGRTGQIVLFGAALLLLAIGFELLLPNFADTAKSLLIATAFAIVAGLQLMPGDAKANRFGSPPLSS